MKNKEIETCKHNNFESNVKVIRLDNGKFMAEVHIRCCDCDMPFIFNGLEMGMDFWGAKTSPNKQEARLSISPKI